MKIAVSATDGSMNALVSEQFGRCAYLLIVDSENMTCEPVLNPAAGMSGGAGPKAVRAIAAKGAELVLTGRVGMNAENALKAAGIRAVVGVSGSKTVRQAVEEHLKAPSQ